MEPHTEHSECVDLSFEVVLPLLCLQSFEAAAAVRGDRHAERSVGSGGELGGEGHGDGPGIGMLAPTHHQIWTGTWGQETDQHTSLGGGG